MIHEVAELSLPIWKFAGARQDKTPVDHVGQCCNFGNPFSDVPSLCCNPEGFVIAIIAIIFAIASIRWLWQLVMNLNLRVRQIINRWRWLLLMLGHCHRQMAFICCGTGWSLLVLICSLYLLQQCSNSNCNAMHATETNMTSAQSCSLS